MVTVADVLNIAFWIGIVLVILALLIAATIYLIRKKKYGQYKVVMWGTDGFGNPTEQLDRGGVFVDPKTGNKRFFLEKTKANLDPDRIPFVLSGKTRIVYLIRNGLKNFRYVNLKLDQDAFSIRVGEEDVNWAVNDYERMKNRFTLSKLQQYMPFIMMAFAFIVIAVIFIYFFKELSVLKEFASSLEEVAKQLAQARAGTVVMGG